MLWEKRLKEAVTKYQATEGGNVMFIHSVIVEFYLNAFFPDYDIPVTNKAQIVKLAYKGDEFHIVEIIEIEP